jgi:hypothetical protein
MVKCAQCGFLAGQNNVTKGLVEVDPRVRKEHKDGQGAIEVRLQHELMPICYVLAADLLVERPGQRPEDAQFVIQRNRDCQRFTSYHQGFSPKEHQEMIQQRELLEWQERRRQEDREWREQQRMEDLEWKERQDQRAKWQLVIVGIIGTLVLFAGQIIAAFIPICCAKK